MRRGAEQPVPLRRVSELSHGLCVFDDCHAVSSPEVRSSGFSLLSWALSFDAPSPSARFLTPTHVRSVTFFIELIAFRVGRAKAQSLAYNPHVGGHHHAAEHVSHAPIAADDGSHEEKEAVGAPKHFGDLETLPKDAPMSAAASQILGVAILEFGVIFRELPAKVEAVEGSRRGRRACHAARDACVLPSDRFSLPQRRGSRISFWRDWRSYLLHRLHYRECSGC